MVVVSLFELSFRNSTVKLLLDVADIPLCIMHQVRHYSMSSLVQSLIIFLVVVIICFAQHCKVIFINYVSNADCTTITQLQSVLD